MTENIKKVPRYVMELARGFRKAPTSTEDFLWQCIRDRRLNGYKFRRQHPIGRYIADFYCHDLSLVVELDGKYHAGEEAGIYDRIRDEEFSLRGLKVIRIAAKELITNPEKVFATIISHLP